MNDTSRSTSRDDGVRQEALVDAAGAPTLTLGVEHRSAPTDNQRQVFEHVLDRFESYAESTGVQVAIVLDEFQDLLKVGGERADWHLRSVMQRHHHVSYVCAGSEQAIIRDIIAKDGAFYRFFEVLSVGPIDDDHLGRWIDARLEGAGVEPNGAGLEIIRRVGPRTQDILHVARVLFFRARPDGEVRDDAVELAIDDVLASEDAVLRSGWENFTMNQQNVLRAVAAGVEELYSTATGRTFGLPAPSSVRRAVSSLLAQGVLHRDRGEIVFDSPFFRLWVRREALPDIPGYRAPAGT